MRPRTWARRPSCSTPASRGAAERRHQPVRNDDAGFVSEMQRETAVLQEQSQRLRSQVVALVRKRF
jgi:hypothetical protein